jgi:hypothetical protein
MAYRASPNGATKLIVPDGAAQGEIPARANGKLLARVVRPPVDEEKIKRAVVLLLEAIGEDPAREGLC